MGRFDSRGKRWLCKKEGAKKEEAVLLKEERRNRSSQKSGCYGKCHAVLLVCWNAQRFRYEGGT